MSTVHARRAPMMHASAAGLAPLAGTRGSAPALPATPAPAPKQQPHLSDAVSPQQGATPERGRDDSCTPKALALTA